jgi:hypothetical protein
VSVADHFWRLIDAAVASPMDVLGLVLLALLVWILTSAQISKTSPVDLSYLLVDSTIGHVTLAKFAGFGAFLSSTWVFVYLAVTGRFDTTYASIYMAVWAGAKVATDYALRGSGTDNDHDGHRDG